ncbi:MAG: hypothetical protein M1833_006200 [Piccolia ochrophora]|nr:MAG: hypothetical protein M1833_006200 [Piccolia ochrophora]
MIPTAFTVVLLWMLAFGVDISHCMVSWNLTVPADDISDISNVKWNLTRHSDDFRKLEDHIGCEAGPISCCFRWPVDSNHNGIEFNGIEFSGLKPNMFVAGWRNEELHIGGCRGALLFVGQGDAEGNLRFWGPMFTGAMFLECKPDLLRDLKLFHGSNAKRPGSHLEMIMKAFHISSNGTCQILPRGVTPYSYIDVLKRPSNVEKVAGTLIERAEEGREVHNQPAQTQQSEWNRP